MNTIFNPSICPPTYVKILVSSSQFFHLRHSPEQNHSTRNVMANTNEGDVRMMKSIKTFFINILQSVTLVNFNSKHVAITFTPVNQLS